MLVITAEIWPGGDETNRHAIGEIRIANESGLTDDSNYSVTLSQRGDPISGAPAFHSELMVFGHRRADGAWALVRAILDRALPEVKTHARPTSGGCFDA